MRNSNMHREFIEEKIKEFEEKADECGGVHGERKGESGNSLRAIGRYLTGDAGRASADSGTAL